MALSIYKPGQGYWTRVLTAVGLGVIILAGAAWLVDEFSFGGKNDNRIYVQAGVAVGIILVFGGLCYWIMNKPRSVDFMIATETEMKKVNWPTRREVVGATVVVIVGMLLMSAGLWVVDIFFLFLFQKIGILVG